MADLHRQLQEYLSQGKAGGGEAKEPLLAPGPATESAGGGEPGRAWLERVGLRWARREPAAASPGWLPGLGRAQRWAAAGACLLLAAFCLGLALLYAPALPLRARKFALLWSLGSALALAGGALLRGGAPCGRPLSAPALLYGVALGATLYAALRLRSTPWTALGACAQVAALLAALLEALPRGGLTALRLALGRLRPGAARAALPV
ncbi:vesicle transport protein SFT2C [Sorex araneus]|uniref:vesicle transport protein SFT2C n=1 Tax=Sorex araneus TaxID=42254 RepID=UPI002433F677|nr:vesicle transport protein SFT2C [Sorex araneus]